MCTRTCCRIVRRGHGVRGYPPSPPHPLPSPAQLSRVPRRCPIVPPQRRPTVQVLVYRTRAERVSRPVLFAVTITTFATLAYGLLAAATKAPRPPITVLDFLYYLSYLKLTITITKYIPQVGVQPRRRIPQCIPQCIIPQCIPRCIPRCIPQWIPQRSRGCCRVARDCACSRRTRGHRTHIFFVCGLHKGCCRRHTCSE